MVVDIDSMIAAPASGRRTALILDHGRYAQAVILQGSEVPWHDVAAYVGFFDQAQGLLRPDAALLDLGALYTHLLVHNDQLRSDMSARSRVGYALKTQLADDATAARAVELASVVSQTSRLPVVVQVPSPMRWLAQTHELSGAGSPADLDLDHAENMSIYVADWLRRLSSIPVSLLLLDGRRVGTPDLVGDDLGSYAPIINTAEHYRWSVALRTDDAVEVSAADLKGGVVPASYWLDDDVAIPAADFLLAEIPDAASPETVLARLAELD